MKISLVFYFSILVALASTAKPYSVVQYWFSNGDCTVFTVQIWDDRDTPDPLDDQLITTGTVSDCKETFDLDDLTPQFDGVSHMRFPSEGERVEAESTLKLYPNPSRNTVTIGTELSSRSQLMITDVKGAASTNIEVIRVSENPLVIDVSNLSPGIYILHVREGDVVKHSRLVIH